MDITNALYYTLSTIAQVLAGFIALSGVFVIFKLQELKKMQFLQVQYFYNYLNSVSGLTIGSFHDCPTIAVTLKTLHKSECIGGMEEEMEKIINDPNVQKGYELRNLISMKNIFSNINLVRLRILQKTKISVISGLFTILFSLVIIPIVPWIESCSSIYIYLIAFIGLTLSISTMAIVIFNCLKERDYLTKQKAIRKSKIQ
ncbi:hypothetical protein SDC9_137336 [bioreactor metagenome]|uniref:Uncharacterized protein n=1 Tax=bioreactor metagenome TaxID=1076179 RepID=A0A645DMA6_9ZZZZ